MKAIMSIIAVVAAIFLLSGCDESSFECAAGQMAVDGKCIEKTCANTPDMCPVCNEYQELHYNADGSGYCLQVSCPQDELMVDGECIKKTCQNSPELCPACDLEYQELHFNDDGSGYCVQTSCPEGLTLQDGVCVEKVCEPFNNGCYPGCLCNLPLFGTVYSLDDFDIPYCNVQLTSTKQVNISLNIGSGITLNASEPEVLYSVSDRGPTLRCSEALSVTGKDVCPDTANGDDLVYLKTDYVPSIYQFALDVSSAKAELQNIMPIKDGGNKVMNGRLHPKISGSIKAYNTAGTEIAYDPDGIDSHGIVKLSDGTFWITDGSLASLLHLDGNAKTLKRLIPEGSSDEYNATRCPTVAQLPALLSKVQMTHGIQSIAINDAETALYFTTEMPLKMDDAADSRNYRIFKMPLDAPESYESYAYVADSYDTFGETGNVTQASVKISEMLNIGNDTLLILERISQTTKIYKVVLSDEAKIDQAFNDVGTTPSFEASDMSGKGLNKVLVFDSRNSDITLLPNIEGLTRLSIGSYLLMNSNQYGMKGEPSKAMIVELNTEAAK